MIELNYDLGEYSEDISDEIIEKIRHIISEALEIHGLSGSYEVSLSFVDDEEIREINCQYRKKDTKTDVLSFPMFTREEIDAMTNAQSQALSATPELLGDIIISVPTAKAQAIEYDHSFTREICFLACHSILHLLGYDHEHEEETAVMQNMERQILGKAGITREHDHEGN